MQNDSKQWQKCQIICYSGAKPIYFISSNVSLTVQFVIVGQTISNYKNWMETTNIKTMREKKWTQMQMIRIETNMEQTSQQLAN